MTDNQSAQDPAVPPDPILHKSYSVPIAVASVLLVGSVALAIADEMFFRRGYKTTQAQYREAILVYLDELGGQRVSVESAMLALDEYKTLDAAVRAAEDAAYAGKAAAGDEFQNLDAEGMALSAAVKTPNSMIAALTYSTENATHHGHAEDAEAKKAEIEKILASEVSGFKWTKKTRRAEFAEPVRYTADDVADMGDDGQKLIGALKPAQFDTSVEEVKGKVADLKARFAAVTELKGALQSKIGSLEAPVGAARKARAQWLDRNMREISGFLDREDGLTSEQQAAQAVIKAKLKDVGAVVYLRDYAHNLDAASIASLRKFYADMPTDPLRQGDIKQIHIREANWVDRCETCHVGTREAVPVNKDDLTAALRKAQWSDEKIASYPLELMTSHPRAAELFSHHDPDTVGCSTCHNGNGVAVTSVVAAHGTNKHWLYTLHPKENIEAGCVQCHQDDIHLDNGTRITAARQTFVEKGCWGCHPYKGHDPEPEAINALSAQVRDLDRAIELKLLRADQTKSLQGSAENQTPEQNAAAADAKNALLAEAGQLRSQQDVARRQLQMRWTERQRVGPNLKDIRAKLRPEILFDWVKDPTSVRLDTKMPVFRFTGDEEVKDVVAFLWQSALSPQEFPEYALNAPAGGNAGRGRELFMTSGTKGCLSCHAIEDEETKSVVGNNRAANLTNLGDKDNYEYVYRWIKAPRHRIVPFNSRTGKDMTAAEAAQADAADVVTAQPTMMPDFRLSDEDARDIATYLVSRKSGKWTTKPDFLDDKDRAERGKKVVQYLGCAGCHEIRGLENEKGIGRDLTTEGSQPLDRLDFGHYTTDAQRGHDPLADWTTQKDGVKLFGDEKPWYRQRGFFMHKLAKPDVYDGAKHLPDRFTRLRMPQFRWSAQEIHDLTSFLLGSVVPNVPSKLHYKPNADQQAIREGWWVVKKYNCQGCHQMTPGETPEFWKLPYFAEVLAKSTHDTVLPPTLVGAGFRMRPEYIAEFLRDPSLGGGTANPVSTRKHLAVRMPTFDLSEDEIAKLVKYFVAMAKQPSVYQPEVLAPLTTQEKTLAAAIWTKANCAQCHPKYTGATPIVTGETKAPDLVYGGRKLRPEWMRRWIRNPQELVPLSSMTKNFVTTPEHRWINEGVADLPEAKAYKGDHVDLMIRWLYHEYSKNPVVK